jgi:hypothetical protein
MMFPVYYLVSTMYSDLVFDIISKVSSYRHKGQKIYKASM